jgi:outer membrane protein TolC
MKSRIVATIFLTFVIRAGLWAQVPDSLMRLVLEQNRELRVAREALQVAVIHASTGNTPPDPQVEFAYLFGKPADIGNRIDFGVSQQLDFPTTYMHRSKVKDIKISQAELEYILTRQQVLLRAKKLWIEQIYLNQMHVLLAERLQQAETIHAMVEQKVLVGEVGSLDLGHSNLMLASLEAEFGELAVLQENTRIELQEIAGGTILDFPDTDFPPPAYFIRDSLLRDYSQGPRMQVYQQELLLKEQKKNLAVSEHLPRISAGYFSETVTDQAYRGMRLGISVPLWENANKVNRAKSALLQAEAEADWYIYQQERDLMQKLNRFESTSRQIIKLEEALESVDNISLLSAALEHGEISLSEYFYSSDFYFRNKQQLLGYKRDLLIQEAELLRVYL